MIRSELKLFIGAQCAGMVQWNGGLDKTRPKNRKFVSGPGNLTAKTTRVKFLAGSGTAQNRFAGWNPDCCRVTRTRC